MSKGADQSLELLTSEEHKGYSVFQELFKIIPGLEGWLMVSGEDKVIAIAELIQKGANGSRGTTPRV
ncbi:hypothetical protein OG21DRAFT_1490611 [Imleria badia]|nr:hypothetical protein OG21DRAFT_1490611 [Imleria badia]